MIPLGANVGGACGAVVIPLGGDVGGAQAKLSASKTTKNNLMFQCVASDHGWLHATTSRVQGVGGGLTPCSRPPAPGPRRRVRRRCTQLLLGHGVDLPRVVYGRMCRVQGSGFRVQGVGLKVQGSGLE